MKSEAREARMAKRVPVGPATVLRAEFTSALSRLRGTGLPLRNATNSSVAADRGVPDPVRRPVAARSEPSDEVGLGRRVGGQRCYGRHP